MLWLLSAEATVCTIKAVAETPPPSTVTLCVRGVADGGHMAEEPTKPLLWTKGPQARIDGRQVLQWRGSVSLVVPSC